TTGSAGPIELAYDFVGGSDGWASEVADYTDATRPDDLLSETEGAPPGFDPADGFFHLAASNRSDDLFLYLYRAVTDTDGLEPGATYEVSYTVEFASNAPSGCAGIGGAPGESVWMKVGASEEEPIPVSEDGDTRLAVDKGGQSQGGEAADVAGVIANGIPCEEALDQDPTPYALVTLEETLDGPVTADDDGRLWLFVGTDSGFEGRTSIWYDRIEVTLERVA
ncbi:MAG: hypothetical protein AB1Z55_04230, partial [Acidimicrobiia bacterium]